MDKISVSCNHNNHVDIIEKEWQGKTLLLTLCQDCGNYLREVLGCDHKTVDILYLSFIDEKLTHVPVCKHQKEYLEPWLNLRKVLNED